MENKKFTLELLDFEREDSIYTKSFGNNVLVIEPLTFSRFYFYATRNDLPLVRKTMCENLNDALREANNWYIKFKIEMAQNREIN